MLCPVKSMLFFKNNFGAYGPILAILYRRKQCTLYSGFHVRHLHFVFFVYVLGINQPRHIVKKIVHLCCRWDMQCGQ